MPFFGRTCVDTYGLGWTGRVKQINNITNIFIRKNKSDIVVNRYYMAN